MKMTRVKEDATALSYEIFKRQDIWVRFRVKTYSINSLNNTSRYYYNEYDTRDGVSIIINPVSYLQINLGMKEDNEIFFIPEEYAVRIARNLAKMTAILDAYDAGEVDIVTVNANGTQISGNFPKDISIKLGANSMKVSTYVDTDRTEVRVCISIDNKLASLSITDFLRLYAVISKLNYPEMTMLMLAYLGPPIFGNHLTLMSGTGDTYKMPQYRGANVSATFGLNNELGRPQEQNNTPRW